MPSFLDLTGQRFGMLTVVSMQPRTSARTRWLCRCDCGKEHTAATDHLRRGEIKSCGCNRASAIRAGVMQHGLLGRDTRTPEAMVWADAQNRCHNPRNKAYRIYGGRGIALCSRWRFGEDGKSGLECFLADMGPRPSAEHSLDRKNNELGYSKENCRWATRKEQQRNMRSNRMIELDGERICVAEAAERYGLKPPTVYSRLHLGWPIDRALSTPLMTSYRRAP